MGGACSVGVSLGNVISNHKKIIVEKGSSEIIMPLIKDVLKESGLGIKDLTGFLVCNGPGNYTSLRVAISTIRGLSLATNKPACGISLFELLATSKGKVLILLKGPAGSFYVQNFSDGVPINSPKLLTLDEIVKSKDFFEFDTIGFRAFEVGKLINSNSCLECDQISFEKFIVIGKKKLETETFKPTPLYVN